MEFLANENFPYPSVELLRSKGFMVFSVQEDHSGFTDKEVVMLAKEKNLIILTFDRDYGEILYKYQETNPPSVVYFRYIGNVPSQAGHTLIDLINTGLELEACFTVIEEGGIRQRKL